MENAACANCGTALAGAYCHNCGQAAENPLQSFRRFLRDVGGEVVHFDSKTWRSIILLLTRPGQLTRTYLDGGRVRYLKPIQLYLFAAAVFFLASSYKPLVNFDPETGGTQSSFGIVSTWWRMDEEQARSLLQRGVSMEVFQERFANRVNTNLPTFLIGSILLFSLALGLFYVRKRLSLMAHVVFALHWIAFYMLLMSLDRLLPGVSGVPNIARVILLIITIVYLAVALRCVYCQSWPVTVLKTVGILLVFNVILALWVISVITIAFQTA